MVKNFRNQKYSNVGLFHSCNVDNNGIVISLPA